MCSRSYLKGSKTREYDGCYNLILTIVNPIFSSIFQLESDICLKNCFIVVFTFLKVGKRMFSYGKYNVRFNSGLNDIDGSLELRKKKIHFDSFTTSHHIKYEEIIAVGNNKQEIAISAIGDNQLKTYNYLILDEDPLLVRDIVYSAKRKFLLNFNGKSNKKQAYLLTGLGKKKGFFELEQEHLSFMTEDISISIPYESVMDGWAQEKRLVLDCVFNNLWKPYAFYFVALNNEKVRDLCHEIRQRKRSMLEGWRPNLILSCKRYPYVEKSFLSLEIRVSNVGKIPAENVNIKINLPTTNDFQIHHQKWKIKRIDPRETQVIHAKLDMHDNLEKILIELSYLWMDNVEKLEIAEDIKPRNDEDVVRLLIQDLDNGIEIELESDKKNRIRDLMYAISTQVGHSMKNYGLYRDDKKLPLERRIVETGIKNYEILKLKSN